MQEWECFNVDLDMWYAFQRRHAEKIKIVKAKRAFTIVGVVSVFSIIATVLYGLF